MFGKKKTAEEWCTTFGVSMLSKDGWNYPTAIAWGTKITKDEFRRRMNQSIIEVIDLPKFRKLI